MNCFYFWVAFDNWEAKMCFPTHKAGWEICSQNRDNHSFLGKFVPKAGVRFSKPLYIVCFTNGDSVFFSCRCWKWTTTPRIKKTPRPGFWFETYSLFDTNWSCENSSRARFYFGTFETHAWDQSERSTYWQFDSPLADGELPFQTTMHLIDPCRVLTNFKRLKFTNSYWIIHCNRNNINFGYIHKLIKYFTETPESK